MFLRSLPQLSKKVWGTDRKERKSTWPHSTWITESAGRPIVNTTLEKKNNFQSIWNRQLQSNDSLTLSQTMSDTGGRHMFYKWPNNFKDMSKRRHKWLGRNMVTMGTAARRLLWCGNYQSNSSSSAEQVNKTNYGKALSSVLRSVLTSSTSQLSFISKIIQSTQYCKIFLLITWCQKSINIFKLSSSPFITLEFIVP